MQDLTTILSDDNIDFDTEYNSLPSLEEMLNKSTNDIVNIFQELKRAYDFHDMVYFLLNLIKNKRLEVLYELFIVKNQDFYNLFIIGRIQLLVLKKIIKHKNDIKNDHYLELFYKFSRAPYSVDYSVFDFFSSEYFEEHQINIKTLTNIYIEYFNLSGVENNNIKLIQPQKIYNFLITCMRANNRKLFNYIIKNNFIKPDCYAGGLLAFSCDKRINNTYFFKKLIYTYNLKYYTNGYDIFSLFENKNIEFTKLFFEIVPVNEWEFAYHNIINTACYSNNLELIKLVISKIKEHNFNINNFSFHPDKLMDCNDEILDYLLDNLNLNERRVKLIDFFEEAIKNENLFVINKLLKKYGMDFEFFNFKSYDILKDNKVEVFKIFYLHHLDEMDERFKEYALDLCIHYYNHNLFLFLEELGHIDNKSLTATHLIDSVYYYLKFYDESEEHISFLNLIIDKYNIPCDFNDNDFLKIALAQSKYKTSLFFLSKKEVLKNVDFDLIKNHCWDNDHIQEINKILSIHKF